MAVTEITGDTIPGWSGKPKESSRALEAAQEYLKMGVSRSIAKVAKKPGKRVCMLEVWSALWGWVERAAAYDDYLSRQEQIEIEKQASAQGEERRRRAEEQSETFRRLMQKIIDKVDKMPGFSLASATHADGKTTVKPARWALKDIAPLLGILLKLNIAAAMKDGEEGDLIPEEFVLDDYK